MTGMLLVHGVHGGVFARREELRRRRRDGGRADEIGLKVRRSHLNVRLLRDPVEAIVLHLIFDRCLRRAILQRRLAARLVA